MKCSEFEEKRRKLDDLSWIAGIIVEKLSRQGWGQDTFYLKLSLAERDYLLELLKEEAKKGKDEE